MESPSPESQSPTSPPSDGDSSPPPPPDDSQSAPPPSSPQPPPSSPPPDDPSPPPEEPASPPPPSPSSDSSLPPESSSPPSPPSPKSSSSPSPPPPSGSSKHSPPPPPPPRSALAPPKSSSRSTPSSDSTQASENDSSSSTSSVDLPTIIGVAVGAGLLLLVMILLCVVCRRKKKKRPDPMSFYGPSDPSRGSRIQNGYGPAGNFYYPNQHPPEASWHGSPAELSVKLRPPPGMPLSPQGNHPPSPAMPPVASAASPHSSWPPPPVPPPYGSSSSDMSSSGFSGSHRAGLPPQHPSMALGFTQSSFSYEELAAATRGFSRDNILGEGGFGFVFKGVLSNGKETAIKCLKSGSGQGDREFQAEVEIISRVHHRHLVSLEGYCIAGAQRILVYEFVPNQTLEYHLHGKDRPTMDWDTRLKIALGSAKGLAYLHEDCHPRIIHRDIKASNILLDDNFEAKVSDFGLAKLTSDNYTHVSTRVMGTFGYLAPEYASSGKLTEKSDTFSFGVMLLELITGRHPVDATGELMEDSLVDWARPLIDSALQSGNFRELADLRLEGDFDPQEMARMVACAGACTRHSAKRRPKMSQVARALEGDSSLDELNTWNKQTQSAVFGDSTGSSSSAVFESGSYAADMKKLRKPPTSGQEYASSEYGATSEYGLNPSSSSSSSGDSQEISSHARRNRMHEA